MAQNIFAGGPVVSEIPPDRLEEAETNELSQPETRPGGGLYKPFQESGNQNIDENQIEGALFDIPKKAEVLAEEEQITLPEEVMGEEAKERTENNELGNTQIQELPETPFIERLTEKGPSGEPGIISAEIARGLQESIIAGQSFNEALTQTDIPADIKSLILDRWEGINNPEVAKQNISVFSEDFSQEFPQERDDKGNFTDPRIQEAFEMVGSAYLVGAESSPVEKNQALTMAFETAGNKAIDGKIFERSVAFEENMSLLKNTDTSPNERMMALTKILKIVDTDQGAKSLKRSDMVEEGGDEKTLDTMIEDAQLTPDYLTAQEALRQAQQDRNTSKITQTQAALHDLIEKAEELTGTALGTFSMDLEVGRSEIQNPVPETV